MTEQEAQQAQTIAEILEHIANFDRGSAPDWTDAYYDRQKLLEIVDSQAQTIAEQAKRIGELEKNADEHVCCLANNGW